MDMPRNCGCKGCRTCLLCEKEFGIIQDKYAINGKDESYVYCPKCLKAWPGWSVEEIINSHPNHRREPIDFPGVYIKLNFLTQNEEQCLLNCIDNEPWDLSQSGRRKQNYGPKCNFKKRKLRLGDFCGFPKFSEFVQNKFKSEPILRNFQTIEQCSLEYDPQRGASIDPHVDDCWIWGERIVTVNLLSDSVLTMRYNLKQSRYNLDCVSKYPAVLDKAGNIRSSIDCYKFENINDECLPIVRITMPRRSLLVLYGTARYEWEHQVLRKDIRERRVCIAYREFTPPYLESGEHCNEGLTILNKALHFWS